jgi:hypothetical protein
MVWVALAAWAATFAAMTLAICRDAANTYRAQRLTRRFQRLERGRASRPA